MRNIHSVTIQDSAHSHWVIEAQQENGRVGFKITQDEAAPSHRMGVIGRSERAQQRPASEFIDSPDGRGTVVRVTLTL